MSRKNGKHVSDEQRKLILIDNGILQFRVDILSNILGDMTFKQLDCLNDALKQIRRGE